MKLSDFIDFLCCTFRRPPKRKRLELRCVPYSEASALINSTTEEWEIADEENRNGAIGFVFLERLEPLPKFK